MRVGSSPTRATNQPWQKVKKNKESNSKIDLDVWHRWASVRTGSSPVSTGNRQPHLSVLWWNW